MASRAVLMFLLGLALALATFSSAAAEGAESRQLAGPGLVDFNVLAKVKLTVDLLQCKRDAQVLFAIAGLLDQLLGNVLQCRAGSVTLYGGGLLNVHLRLLHLIYVRLSVLNVHNELVTLKLRLDLLKLGLLVNGVHTCDLKLVEDVERKLLKVVVHNKVLYVLDLKIKL